MCKSCIFVSMKSLHDELEEVCSVFVCVWVYVLCARVVQQSHCLPSFCCPLFCISSEIHLSFF